MDDLEAYDKVQYDIKGGRQRHEIAKIVDTVVRHAQVDPFDWDDRTYNFSTLILYNGLPYENLRTFLTLDELYATPQQRSDFIEENLLLLRPWMELAQESIKFLTSSYERLQSSSTNMLTDYTLLQYILCCWLRGNEVEDQLSCLVQATGDLYRRSHEGTPLDFAASLYGADGVKLWLRFLSKNRINMLEYGHYEQSQHLGGIINQGSVACCRVIYVDFEFDEGDQDVVITIQNVCDPRFEHLDPEYRCEDSRCRESCITQEDGDGALIDEAGKPRPSAPGSWRMTPKRNSELSLVCRSVMVGWQYVEFVERIDREWKEHFSVTARLEADDDSSSDHTSETESATSTSVLRRRK